MPVLGKQAVSVRACGRSRCVSLGTSIGTPICYSPLPEVVGCKGQVREVMAFPDKQKLLHKISGDDEFR